MILLDTSVVSELIRPAMDPRVGAWMAAQPVAGILISAVTEVELLLGVALLPSGKRRDAIHRVIEAIMAADFAGRVIPFDSAAASGYATIAAERRKAGRPIAQFDAQIAATARSRNASLATRNIDDFELCGVEIIDPWRDRPR